MGASPPGPNYFIFMQFSAAFFPKINEHTREHTHTQVCIQLQPKMCFLMLYYVVGLEFK